jgi:hypothetical protein
LTISPDDESRLGFETLTKMTPTVDYPANNFENTHHGNLKTTLYLANNPKVSEIYLDVDEGLDKVMSDLSVKGIELSSLTR